MSRATIQKRFIFAALFDSGFTLLRSLFVVRRFLHRDIRFKTFTNDGTCTTNDYKRLTYYAFLGLFFAKMYARLIGVRLSKHERYVQLLIGCLTPLFDDFYDNHVLANKSIEKVVEEFEHFQPVNQKELLIKTLYQKLIIKIGDIESIITNYRDVLKGQEMSRLQKEGKLSYRQLLHITWQKGGASFVFTRKLMPYKLIDGEADFLYRMGGLMQLESDVFDIYRDYNEQIQTIPQQVNSWIYFTKKYQREVVRLRNHLARLGYKSAAKKQFGAWMLLIFARGMVASYILHQQSQAEIFNPGSLTRKQLVCDMEKPANFFLMIKYAFKLGR